MKRLWISVVTLVSIFLLSLLNSWVLCRTTEDLCSTLEQAQVMAEGDDWASARMITAQAEQDWQTYSNYLYVVLRHSESDEVIGGFREVQELLKWEECPDYAAANARLMESISLLSKMERLSIKNLL